jgi:very-short-patch-repair endonuclease
VLACGQGAVLGHRSAASLWGLHPAAGGPVEVTTPASRRRGGAGLRVHRVRALDPRDIRRHFGLPLTAPARTLLDLAELIDPGALRRAVERASSGARPARPSSGRCSIAPPAAAGRARSPRRSRPTPTRSQAEERLLALLRAAALPPTAVNARVGGHEVDLLWAPQRLVVEVDGFAYHGGRAAFERDRLRDAELRAAGYRVARVTWRQLVERPEALIARLAQALARC